ncbi:MAG TPA: DUF4124 domain-containing protein [Steroidobacteraceae bacterium]|nr:DUF4124 domain-containing protein [Steroidobacteraceae bacterium]
MPLSSRTVSFGWRDAVWAGLLAALIPMPSHADEVYKSVDAQGHVTYSDRPTTNTAKKTEVEVQQADPAEAQRLAKERQLLKEEDSQRRKQQVLEDRAKQQEAHLREQRCAAARQQYNDIKDAARLFKTDADGNRTYLTDAEADLRREVARQAVQTACAQ